MQKLLLLATVLLALLLSACGQKGPLYIPSEQEGPAVAPASSSPSSAEDINQELEDAKRAPSQDDVTLDESEDER